MAVPELNSMTFPVILLSLCKQAKMKADYIGTTPSKDVQDKPSFPTVVLPVEHSARVTRMLDILPAFSEQDLLEDEKLAYILSK